MYIIKGFVKDNKGKGWARRYIQLHETTKHPVITTKSGYRKYNQIMFATEQEAYGFLYKFMNSEKRRAQYEYDWEVVEYNKNSYFDDKYICKHHFRLGKTNLRYTLDTEYGKCYTFQYIK